VKRQLKLLEDHYERLQNRDWEKNVHEKNPPPELSFARRATQHIGRRLSERIQRVDTSRSKRRGGRDGRRTAAVRGNVCGFKTKSGKACQRYPSKKSSIASGKEKAPARCHLHTGKE